MRASREGLVSTLLPKLLVTLPPHDLFPRVAPLWLEIGFGGGEHLVAQARQNPHVNLIGCEPYVNGMASLLAQVAREKLDNVRVYDNDARLLLDALPDESLERIFVLFPDPWPKARHHKKRIVSQNSLALFHRKLTMGGLLRIATDHEDYGAWILEHALAFRRFRWCAASRHDWSIPPQGWVSTRYQTKAEAEGRKAVFLDWIKS